VHATAIAAHPGIVLGGREGHVVGHPLASYVDADRVGPVVVTEDRQRRRRDLEACRAGILDAVP
jgi:hypothetical protein